MQIDDYYAQVFRMIEENFRPNNYKSHHHKHRKDVQMTEEMSELLHKYNELKHIVTSLEKENKQLKEQLSGDRENNEFIGAIKYTLEKVIEILQQLLKRL